MPSNTTWYPSSSRSPEHPNSHLTLGQPSQSSLVTNRRPTSGFQLLQERSIAVFDWSYFIAWVGVGWVLVSALLFVGASVCLKREMYSEKRRNLPYIMPGRWRGLRRG